MKRAPSRPRVAILGCGHVGKALAVQLLDPEYRGLFRGELRLWSRSARSSRALRTLVEVQAPGSARRVRVMPSAAEAMAQADVVLLCVADAAVVPLVRELARVRDALHRQIVLTTSGLLSLRSLAALRRRGCATGRLHPLAAIPSGLEECAMIMAPFALEGDPPAVRAARRIVARIEGRALLLRRRPGAVHAYHAGASLLGGGLVALLYLAERVMADSVTSRAALRDGLEEFTRGTLGNSRFLGPERALTGAISRGAEELVRGHLRALRRVPEALALYRLLGAIMLDLAQHRGSVDRLTRRRIESLFQSSMRDVAWSEKVARREALKGKGS